MTAEVHLVLEDGSVFTGEAFGAQVEAYGEVVFTTSMTGYQEMLTDPSFAGQIVMPTYPLIGNYGINDEDVESKQIQVSGFVVREANDLPSNRRSQGTLHDYLAAQGIPGISGLDTRAITRRLRSHGVMMGIISTSGPVDALARLKELPRYDNVDFVPRVSTNETFTWDGAGLSESDGRIRIVVTDCGVKYNILRMLEARGCEVVVCPATATAEEILSLKPHGVLISPGPGDPLFTDYAVEAAKSLMGKVPLLGICLGHQIIARALGAGTFKLKFGHRGANHPVKDLATGRVHITAQNHGYAVSPEGLPPEVEVSHVNVNDGTVEGLRHKTLPVMTIQYHSEASPGPLDNEYIFDEFVGMARNNDV
ncbi:MAG: carbamoyl-phosphate synthase small subunit [Chloroflexi bacterium]|jgi:carbamoyl-phosphate synthase small subunit|nr:MAG: carbamoyl-phosphate synthase small subunit [Chloroflexota bacterium]